MVPEISPKQIVQIVRRYLPDARVDVQSINPEYRSWRAEVETSKGKLEFLWGALTGFGVSDFNSVENENPFAPYDHNLESLAEAEAFLKSYWDEKV